MARQFDVNDAIWDLMVANRFRHKYKNAKDRGIDFTLSFRSMKNLLEAKKCYYTGITLTFPDSSEDKSLKATDLTIDRIDSSKGYVSGNVVACSHAFNQLKSQFEGAGLIGIKTACKAFGKVMKRMEKQ